MTYALVQRVSHLQNTSQTTNTAAITSSQTGSLLVVHTGQNGAGGISSVTDNQSNTYTSAASTSSHNVYYCANATAGVTSVVVTYSSNQNSILFVSEYSGIQTTGAFDKGLTYSEGSTTTTPTTSSFAPTRANELAVVSFYQTSSGQTGVTAGTGYNNAVLAAGTQRSISLEDAALTTTASTTASFTITPTSSPTTYMIVVLFKEIVASVSSNFFPFM